MTSLELPSQVTEVINRLRAYTYTAFIVGKCVRELIIEHTSIDFDIITNAPTGRICEIFDKYNTNTDNILKGEIIIHVRGMVILVSPYRRCVSKDGQAIYTENILEDLAGRDFSFNAIAYNDCDGFLDPFGGLNCLTKGNYTVSAIGEEVYSNTDITFPVESALIRDPVNVLLALGYYSSGEFAISPKTKEGIIKNAKNLTNIPLDAIRRELSWVIRGKRVTDVLEEYKPVFFTLIPEFQYINEVPYRRKEHQYDMLTHSIKSVGFASPILTLRYALLFHSLGKPDCFSLDKDGVGHYYGHAERSKIYAVKIMTRLGFKNEDIREVAFLIENHVLDLGADRRAIKLQLRNFSADKLIKLLQFKYANLRAKSPEFEGAAMNYKRLVDAVNEIVALNECYSLQQLAITTFDLIQHKLVKTEEEAQILLEKLLNLVIDSPIYNTQSRLINLSKKWLIGSNEVS